MLTIKEISSEEQLNTFIQNIDTSKDYLFVLKYNGTLLLSDNGTLIPITGVNNITEEEINIAIQEVINELQNNK